MDRPPPKIYKIVSPPLQYRGIFQFQFHLLTTERIEISYVYIYNGS